MQAEDSPEGGAITTQVAFVCIHQCKLENSHEPTTERTHEGTYICNLQILDS